jgi:cytochrome c biogenesis protein CcmG/thiol:disulfide interchange protein DsbE
MVNFWTSGCGACVAEMPDIQAAYEAWSGEKDLVVLAVNAKQHVVYVQRFLDERDWCTIPIPLDTDGAVARAYRITRIPRTFFIDGTGIIRKVQAGRFQDKEEILAILDKLD